jgi:hypothetical protein
MRKNKDEVLNSMGIFDAIIIGGGSAVWHRPIPGGGGRKY